MPFFARSPLRKLGRKQDEERRRGEAEGIRALAFDLESLELVPVDAEVGLLRVAGRWTAPAPRPLQDIVLSLRFGGDSIELRALPDLVGAAPLASPRGEPWRAAYTASAILIEDPHVELTLVADGEAPVTIPRPSDWEPLTSGVEQQSAGAEREEEVAEAAGRPVQADEPWNAELERLAQLQVEAERLAEELEANQAEVPAETLEQPDAEELTRVREELEAARTALDVERRRREALEEEIRARATVEDDLRNAIAMQEAELAAAVAQAAQRARRAERQKSQVATAGGETANGSQPEALDNDFRARLERARRAAETAP